jgi:hypothetical protein
VQLGSDCTVSLKSVHGLVPARDQKFGIFYAAVEDAIRDCVTV